MALSIQDIIALIKDSPEMLGTIRTQEKCPVCGHKFGPGFTCKAHKTIPTRFYIDFSWQGKRIRVFSDRLGDPLDSYRRALGMQSIIDEQIREKTFDPTKYIKAEASKFWSKNLLDRFLGAKLESIKPSYRAHYRCMVKEAQQFFGVRDVRELRKLDLVNYADHLRGLGISAKTQKNYLDHFRAFLGWCRADLEIIPLVPAFPKLELTPRAPRWLSREDQIKLLGFIPAADQPIIRFLMLHGCRPAEARALKVKDVDIQTGTITISATFSGRVYQAQRKGRKSRAVIIPIHPEILEYLASRISVALPEAWVFVNPINGLPYSENKLRRVWEGVRAKAGLTRDLRLYDATRHSVATQLRSAGVSLADIRDQLGHSDLRTTEKYAHGNLENLRANLEKLSLNNVREFKMAVTGQSPDEGRK